MSAGKQKKPSAPDILALMRADPPPATREFTDRDQRLIEGEGGNFFTLCMIWCDCFVLPQLFARRRRALGDPSASPRDHECGCDVLNNSFRPVCEKRRAGCKFDRPPGPPRCFRAGVPYEPPREPLSRLRFAVVQAQAAMIAYADAAPAARCAMERRVLRALSSERAGAFAKALAAAVGAAAAPVSSSTAAPRAPRNR